MTKEFEIGINVHPFWSIVHPLRKKRFASRFSKTLKFVDWGKGRSSLRAHTRRFPPSNRALSSNFATLRKHCLCSFVVRGISPPPSVVLPKCWTKTFRVQPSYLQATCQINKAPFLPKIDHNVWCLGSVGTKQYVRFQYILPNRTPITFDFLTFQETSDLMI